MTDEFSPEVKPAESIFPEVTSHELPVQTVTVIPARKMDSPDFLKELKEFFEKSRHTWRSSASISTHFNVDAVELNKLLAANEEFISKSSNQEMFYSLKSKVKEEKPKHNVRPVFTEADLFALSQVSLCVDMVEKVLRRYGMDIASNSSESFSFLVEGKSKLEAGIMHLANAMKVNLGKLE